MEKLTGINTKGLTYRDIVIYLYIEQYPLKTARDLSLISSCNYGRLTESLNRLLEREKIIKTREYPNRFMINE